MIELSAKAHFLKTNTPEQLASIAGAVGLTSVKSAMVNVLSQMADEGQSTIAIAGAKRFRSLLLNIAEPVEAMKVPPSTAFEPVPTSDGK